MNEAPSEATMEAARSARAAPANFNPPDFALERARLEETQRATFNILEDFESEKARLEETQGATFNILDDFESEKARLGETQRATFNILDDFVSEMVRLEETQRATLNILEDLDVEKHRVERAEKELAHRAQELARSNRELEQFAYVASHDLQEPLRTVYGSVSRLARQHQGKLGSDSDEMIDFALKGAERMKQLVQDLLTFSRVGTQAAPLVRVEVDAVLGKALELMVETFRQTTATITFGSLPPVLADESQLMQLFQNLIGNAIKFRGRAPPIIEVGAEPEPPNWRFYVKDNGIGIAREDLHKLFVIFQRLHTREEYPGSGVGLAICKKIVERHGGRIWVESVAGQGSTFCFTLPMLETPREAWA